MTKADVQGRLNRETNPIPGERPGFNPQFIDSDGYATDVTPNTPFPSGSYVQTDAGAWVPQKGNNDGAAHVQLTGSNVVVFEYLNSTLNLNNAGNRWYGANAVSGTTNRRPADVSRFSKKLVYVKNNYNVMANVNVNFYKDVEPFSGSSHGPFIYRAVDDASVPVGATAIFSIDTEPKMGLPSIGCGVNIWANNPTEGSLDIVLIGGV